MHYVCVGVCTVERGAGERQTYYSMDKITTTSMYYFKSLEVMKATGFSVLSARALTKSLRACVTVSLVCPPRMNIAVFVFSTSFGALCSRARFTRWFLGLLRACKKQGYSIWSASHNPRWLQLASWLRERRITNTNFNLHNPLHVASW